KLHTTILIRTYIHLPATLSGPLTSCTASQEEPRHEVSGPSNRSSRQVADDRLAVRDGGGAFLVGGAARGAKRLERGEDAPHLLEDVVLVEGAAAGGQVEAVLDPRAERVDHGAPVDVAGRGQFLLRVGERAAVGLERRLRQQPDGVVLGDGEAGELGTD